MQHEGILTTGKNQIKTPKYILRIIYLVGIGKSIVKKTSFYQVLVAHTYNSCYSGEDLKFEASLRQIVHETLS
jgi:hypothetical protein